MLQEIEHDIKEETLYKSENLNEEGRATYPALIKEAARSGSDVTLAAAIHGRLNPYEKPRKLEIRRIFKGSGYACERP